MKSKITLPEKITAYDFYTKLKGNGCYDKAFDSNLDVAERMAAQAEFILIMAKHDFASKEDLMKEVGVIELAEMAAEIASLMLGKPAKKSTKK